MFKLPVFLANTRGERENDSVLRGKENMFREVHRISENVKQGRVRTYVKVVEEGEKVEDKKQWRGVCKRDRQKQ